MSGWPYRVLLLKMLKIFSFYYFISIQFKVPAYLFPALVMKTFFFNPNVSPAAKQRALLPLAAQLWSEFSLNALVLEGQERVNNCSLQNNSFGGWGLVITAYQKWGKSLGKGFGCGVGQHRGVQAGTLYVLAVFGWRELGGEVMLRRREEKENKELD